MLEGEVTVSLISKIREIVTRLILKRWLLERHNRSQVMNAPQLSNLMSLLLLSMFQILTSDTQSARSGVSDMMPSKGQVKVSISPVVSNEKF